MKKYRFPSSKSNDPNDIRIAGLISRYTCEYSGVVDNDFKTLLSTKYGWLSRSDSKQKNQDDIDKFHSANGYLPSKRSKDLVEAKLGEFCITYINSTGHGYDEQFANKHKESLTYERWKWEQNWKKCQEFKINTNKWPSQYSKDLEEKRLGYWLMSNTKRSGRSFNQNVYNIYKGEQR